MNENPYQPPPQKPIADVDKPDIVSTDRAAYNLIADTLTGVNARWSDNRFQLIFVLISVALGALAMAVLALLYPSWFLPWYGGALIGAFLGLVAGIFASGLFLMVYRASRHLRGKHD